MLSNAFVAFGSKKLSRLTQFYPRDFSSIELSMLEDQLQKYIIDMRSQFVELKSIGDLAVKMVVTKRDKVYPLVSVAHIDIDFTGCNNYCRENIFCYEYCEDSTA